MVPRKRWTLKSLELALGRKQWTSKSHERGLAQRSDPALHLLRVQLVIAHHHEKSAAHHQVQLVDAHHRVQPATARQLVTNAEDALQSSAPHLASATPTTTETIRRRPGATLPLKRYTLASGTANEHHTLGTGAPTDQLAARPDDIPIGTLAVHHVAIGHRLLRKKSSRSPARPPRRTSPIPPKFVVHLDAFVADPQESRSDTTTEPSKASEPSDVKPSPRTLPKPVPRTSRLEGRIGYSTSSRLEGRVSREGRILSSSSRDSREAPATSSGVLEKIKTLKNLCAKKPQLSIRSQLEDLRARQTTHSVGHTTTLRTPDARLIKDPPMFGLDMFPEGLHIDQIYDEVLKILLDEQPNEDGIRPLDEEMLASFPLALAQPNIFEVSRHPDAEAHPLHPYHECNGHDEDSAHFHQPVALAQLVTNRRWKNQLGIRGVTLMQNLLSRVKMLKVRSLAQMTLLKYINRLRSNDEERTPIALQFVYEVLNAQNLRRELPALLKKYQPQITDEDTSDPWPSRKDLRHALESWSCYCVHAAVYLMEHLSGPIIYEPDRLPADVMPPQAYQSLVLDMIDDHAGTLNTLRHQMYRQYVYAYIKAIKVGLEEFAYERYDDDKKKKMPLGTPTALPIALFADAYILDTFGADLRDDVQPLLIEMTDRDSVIEQVIHYFPASYTKKVVFWFGPDFIAAGNEGFGFVLASLCYHYSANFGNVEPYVVLPSYVRQETEKWTHSVLATYLQRKDIMPYARVALGPTDLQLWERDERRFRETGKLADWDYYGLDEQGHYVSGDLVSATKANLISRHDLDLWIDDSDLSSTDDVHSTIDEDLSEATPSAMEPSTSDHRHTSSASGSSATAPALDYMVPSTSDLRTYSVPELDARATAASITESLTHEGATAEERQLIASTVQHISNEVLSKATLAALKVMQPKLANIQKLGQQQRSPKKSDQPKDSRNDPRKDKDRKPRKRAALRPPSLLALLTSDPLHSPLSPRRFSLFALQRMTLSAVGAAHRRSRRVYLVQTAVRAQTVPPNHGPPTAAFVSLSCGFHLFASVHRGGTRQHNATLSELSENSLGCHNATL